MSLGLRNNDTGELICRNEALIGTGGAQAQNESGFVVGIPPCVWGDEADGLLPPPKIHWMTTLPASSVPIAPTGTGESWASGRCVAPTSATEKQRICPVWAGVLPAFIRYRYHCCCLLGCWLAM